MSGREGGIIMRRLLAFSLGILSTVPAARGDNPPAYRPATVTPANAHSCAGFYPEAIREVNVGGVASLNFKITVNGTVSNVVVAKSSGNSDLDDAAKTCVRTWRYVPLQKDGKPVEAAWDADIEFKVVEKAQGAPQPGKLPLLVEQDRDLCLHYPFWAHRHHAEGNAILTYTVIPDGQLTDIAMTKSSGDQDLDEAALKCVKSYKYRPGSGGDTPKPVTAQVTYSYLEHAPSLVRWNFKGASLPSIDAMQEISRGVAECLQGAGLHPEFVSGFSGMTTLRAHYYHGEMESMSVVATSGNDALDRYAVGCYKSEVLDAERAEEMRRVGNAVFHVLWRQHVHS